MKDRECLIITRPRGRGDGDLVSHRLELAGRALAKAREKAKEVECARLRIAHGIVFQVPNLRTGRAVAQSQAARDPGPECHCQAISR